MYVHRGNLLYMNTNTTGLHFHNGEWIALTHSASKTFKTERAATAWLVRRGYDIDGTRLA